MEADSNYQLKIENERLITYDKKIVEEHKNYQINIISSKLKSFVPTEMEINTKDNFLELTTSTGVTITIFLSDLLDFSISPEIIEHKKGIFLLKNYR